MPTRRVHAAQKPAAETAATTGPGDKDTAFTKARKASWARLLRKLLEVDPLLCRCGAAMRVVAFIHDQAVVDRILDHIKSPRSKSVNPFEPCPPPAH